MSGSSAELREEVGRLTVDPVDGFVAARTARVKELRGTGRRGLAADLAAVRRPTLPAWAVDQLAHHHGDALDELFDAATRLRTAQAEGADRSRVREATSGYTAAVRRLRALAGERLAAAGSSAPAHLDEVEATLLAAATDPELAADVRAGALVRPAPAPGFAAFALPGAAPSGADGDAVDDREEDADAGGEDGDEVSRARAQRRVRAERRRDALRVERAALERSVATADERLAELDEVRTRTAQELDDLRGRVAELEAELEAQAAGRQRAERQRDAAGADLERVTRELTDVEAELDG